MGVDVESMISDLKYHGWFVFTKEELVKFIREVVNKGIDFEIGDSNGK